MIGRLTRDPELRQTGNGTSYCRISIANNRNYTANGERREEVSFFNCTAWGRQAEVINQYARKGKQVAIDGRLQQRSWQDQEGKNQSSVDVVIERLQLLGSASDNAGGSGAPSGSYSGGSSYQGQGGGGYSGSQSGGYGSQGGTPSYGGNSGGSSAPPEPDFPGMMDDDDIPF